MRRMILALVVLALAQTASAQDWAKAAMAKSPRHSEWVTVKHDGRSVDTFVVYPESKDKRPVVLIIHEIFGMTDWVEDWRTKSLPQVTSPLRQTCYRVWAPTAAAHRRSRRTR